jgi:hypothetical protein
MHSRSRKVHSIISMNENKENYSFEKKSYFFLFNNLFFREKKIISLFFIETFRLDISIVTKMLIVKFDSNSNDDVSSNVNNSDFFNDEIFFFIIDFETTVFLKLFRTNFRIEILSYYFSSLSLNICMKIARYVT